jgi:hypothetical protein
MSDSVTFGEIDWNDGDDSGTGGAKTEFMRLDQGENTVRIMGNPIQFYIHWVDTSEGTRKVNSPIASPELVRRLEEEGWKRRPRWLVKVLDRKDENFKLLEIGPQIYSGIKALFNHRKWGKVTAYDITIERGPKGSQPLYRVTPDPKEPLEERFKAQFMDFNDNLNIEKLTQPAEPASVLELLGWSADSGSTSDSMADDDDEFFSFQS